jgi:hypothetical protein
MILQRKNPCRDENTQKYAICVMCQPERGVIVIYVDGLAHRGALDGPGAEQTAWRYARRPKEEVRKHRGMPGSTIETGYHVVQCKKI